MENITFVKLMIIGIPLFGAVGSLLIPEICPEYIEHICACNNTEKAETLVVSLRMCYNGNECKPCPMSLQDHGHCSLCPGNICPVCSGRKISMPSIGKSESVNLQKSGRESRDLRKIAFGSFCHMDFSLHNGNLECTSTLTRKECVVTCFEPYTVGGKKSMTFSCCRKKNKWEPPLQTCKDKTRGRNRGNGKVIMRRYARESRSLQNHAPLCSWCVIDIKMNNGKIECSATNEKMECVVSCVYPYTINGQQSMRFQCYRVKNIWEPEMQTCVDMSGGYTMEDGLKPLLFDTFAKDSNDNTDAVITSPDYLFFKPDVQDSAFDDPFPAGHDRDLSYNEIPKFEKQ